MELQRLVAPHHDPALLRQHDPHRGNLGRQVPVRRLSSSPLSFSLRVTDDPSRLYLPPQAVQGVPAARRHVLAPDHDAQDHLALCLTPEDEGRRRRVWRRAFGAGEPQGQGPVTAL